MRAIGITLIVLGIILATAGPLVITIYAVYDLVTNFGTLSGAEALWDICLIFLKDLLCVVPGITLYILGMLILRKE